MNHQFRILLLSCLGIISLTLINVTSMVAQNPSQDDAFMIKKIYETALTESSTYQWLFDLSEKVGGRLTGSPGSYKGIDYTASELSKLNVDTVWKQPCIVPRWERRGPEVVRISTIDTSITLRSTTLGNSNGSIVAGEIIEVFSVEDLEKMDTSLIKGKIVFYNRPMDPRHVNVFRAYGGAVGQRVRGPAVASRMGAVGCIVRSMTTNIDTFPHTGVTRFGDEAHIPAMAIATVDAELLSAELKKGPVTAYMQNHSRLLPDTMSYNVVAEIKGSVYPDSIIVVGGHLDSWDLGGGAHDDGSGCVQSMAVIEILQKIGYQPRHTLRSVMFMNEENGLGGGRAYADSSNARGEFHMAALESDSGGFTPRGFRTDAHPDVLKDKFKKMYEWLPLMQPYGIDMNVGGSGADISPLKSQKGLLIGLSVDSQRYFDFHHTSADRITAVNKRELELGAAAMTALIYLIDTHGL